MLIQLYKYLCIAEIQSKIPLDELTTTVHQRSMSDKDTFAFQ